MSPDSGAESLIDDLLAGKQRALARVITKIENREPGYRDLVSALHAHTGHADVIGITGSPGAGKSTLVDKMAEAYREEGLTVGIIAIDPASPYTGGAVLGDRIRMASTVGDMEVFFRSMSARGSLGGLSTATADAVKALDAFGKDRIVIETVGAGQNEVDIVRTADTVAVLVPPASGDDVQMLKAGILEIADVFVVNKADLDGADRTVRELSEMIEMRGRPAAAPRAAGGGHHGADAAAAPEAEAEAGEAESDRGAEETEGAGAAGEAEGAGAAEEAENDNGAEETEEAGDGGWTPPIVETVASTGEGVEEFMAALEEHAAYLRESGQYGRKVRDRYAAEIRTLLREDAGDLLAEEIRRRGGIGALVERVVDRESDPYAVADEVVAPIEECVRERRD